jgi:tellurite methyltransferase
MPERDASTDPRFDAAGWELIRRLMPLRQTFGPRVPSLVDLGCGRGRDIIYLARQGFRVLGVDSSPLGLRRAERRAARYDIPLRTRRGDLRTIRLGRTVDVVFSSSALNALPPGQRPRRFAHFRRATRRGGLHVVNVFRELPCTHLSIDEQSPAMPFGKGELRRYYRAWSVLESTEMEIQCGAEGAPHRHRYDLLVARRPPGAAER